MSADRTNIGGLSTDNDMATVAAFPDTHTTLAEHFHCLDVVQEGTITLFMVLLNGCHTTELLC